MTSHRYPPLPSPIQRDESDRVGEILDIVRRIEARMTATSERRAAIYAEVSRERERQEAKFPGQRLPLVEPEDEPGRIDLPRTVKTLADREKIDREVCDSRARHGSLTWLDVAREEFAEAMHALGKLQAGHGSKAEAQAECVQAIAVLVRLLESEHFDDNVVAEGGYVGGEVKP